MSTLTAKQAQLIKYLYAYRLENYGYDWRMFRKLVSQRYRAKKALKRAITQGQKLNWDCAMSHRIDWNEKGGPGYTVGQSANEEITNLMRQLVRSDALWLS